MAKNMIKPAASMGRKQMIPDEAYKIAYENSTGVDGQQAVDIDRLKADNANQLRNISPANSMLGGLIQENNSLIIQVIGDSTGNDSTEWVWKLAYKLATAFPRHNIKYQRYNENTKLYETPTIIQNVGEDRHIYSAYQGVNAYNAILYDSEVDITSGDADISMRIAMDDWQAGAVSEKYILAKIGTVSTTDWCWGFRIKSNIVEFVWTETGNSADLKFASTGIDATSFVDGEAKWIRATLDVDNGAGGYTFKGYTSTNGAAWTESNSVTGAAPTSIHVNTNVNYYMGNRGVAIAATSPGIKFYDVYIRDGINGRIASPQPIDMWHKDPARNPANQVIAGTPRIEIYNGSISGSSVTNWDDEVYLGGAVPKTYGALLFINLGHNDITYTTGKDYTDKLDALHTKIDTKCMNATKILITQNPQIDPYDKLWQVARAQRRKVLMGYARANGMYIIDTYLKYLQCGIPLTELIQAVDGLHPNEAGQDMQTDFIFESLALISG